MGTTRTRRTAASTAVLAAVALGAAALPSVAAADPALPKPEDATSCAALAEAATDTAGLKTRLTDITTSVGGAGDGGRVDLIGLYSTSQEIPRSLREVSGRLRQAADQVAKKSLRESTLSLADTLDEEVGFMEQLNNPAALKPATAEVAARISDLSNRGLGSLQSLGDNYRTTCGMDLGLGSLSPNQQAPAAPAPSQADSSKAAPQPPVQVFNLQHSSLLAPAPVR